MNSFEKLTDLPQTNDSFYSDFEKRYANTFVLVQETPDAPEEIMDVHRKRDYNLYSFWKLSGEVQVNIDTCKWRIEPYTPETGYYTYRDQVIYVYKNPQRQWKRSLCSSIYCIASAINTEVWLHRSQFSLELLNAMLVQEYKSLDSVEKPTNIAINRSFACIYTAKTKEYNLVYKRFPIAKLDVENKEIYDLNPTLKQEIQDLLTRTNVRLWKIK